MSNYSTPTELWYANENIAWHENLKCVAATQPHPAIYILYKVHMFQSGEEVAIYHSNILYVERLHLLHAHNHPIYIYTYLYIILSSFVRLSDAF